MIRFGVVCGAKDIERIQSFGYDYIENHVTEIAQLSDLAFEDYRALCSRLNFFVEACCVLLPSNVNVFSDNNGAEIGGYLDMAFHRLEKLSTRIVVFGSGKARTYPESLGGGAAWERLRDFTGMLCRKAEKYGLTVALEPLNRKECNILNSVSEAYQLAREVGYGNCRVLADYYHIGLMNEPLATISTATIPLSHVHIANPDGRAGLCANDRTDYAPFFNALAQNKYNGRLSVEPYKPLGDSGLKETLEVMRKLSSDAGL